MTGGVRGASGTVKLYRERPGSPRELAGSAPLAADGSFTFMDTPSVGPFVYRAVYAAPPRGSRTPPCSMTRSGLPQTCPQTRSSGVENVEN